MSSRGKPFQRSSGWARLAEIRPPALGPGRAQRWLTARAGWVAVAGTDLARRLPLLDFRDGYLIIGVPDLSWESFLRELEGRLLGRLQRQPGLEQVLGMRGRLLPAPVKPMHRPAPAEGKARPVDGGDARTRLRRLAERMQEEKPGGKA